MWLRLWACVDLFCPLCAARHDSCNHLLPARQYKQAHHNRRANCLQHGMQCSTLLLGFVTPCTALTLPAACQVRRHGRRGLAAQRYSIDVDGESYPVVVSHVSPPDTFAIFADSAANRQSYLCICSHEWFTSMLSAMLWRTSPSCTVHRVDKSRCQSQFGYASVSVNFHAVCFLTSTALTTSTTALHIVDLLYVHL